MRRAFWIAAGIVLAALVMFLAGANTIIDWLWFRSLGYTAVFWTSLATGWITRLTAFALAFTVLYLSYFSALKVSARPGAESFFYDLRIEPRHLRWFNLGASAILAFFVSAAFNPGWQEVQQFVHSVRVGTADPILGLDIGYYLFRLPVWRGLNNLLQAVSVLSLLGSGLIFLGTRAFWRQGGAYALLPRAKVHLTVLAVLFFLAKIWGYVLGRQALLLQKAGRITGVDYTAAAVRLPVYNILIAIAAACIVALLIGLVRRGVRLLAGGIILLLTASFLLGTVYPALVRFFVVRPNEYRVQQPYLEHHITHTRRAFGLDRFTVKNYTLAAQDKPSSWEGDPTLANLRLWDYRQLKLSYEQLQTLRPYYVFNDIDIDRYTINGRQRQVMLAARELDPSRLPAEAQNWVNLHLTYTHGYGVAMNAVSEVNAEGQPVFLVGNIPPVTAPGIDLPPLLRPQIYFGETQSGYIIVPNDYQEFDYAAEEEANAFTRYEGQDGVRLASFWTRLLFALCYGEYNFLISPAITAESKVLFHRRVDERVRKLAPFLEYDPDPYIVMAGGRLFWIIDAYTYSANYPYAARHPEAGINYIRNPVKAVVDAYEGTARFYLVDPDDPVIRVWARVFPNLFVPAAEMPAEIRAHLRYPERLFTIQRDMLLLYHMTDTATFFGGEDAWAVPTETTTGGREEEMVPYYVILRLPGEEWGEFVLMQPLKPGAVQRKNMIAWMAARADGDGYGHVLLYRLPKDRVIYGPLQVEGRIAQNPAISELLTLWGQHQSSVVRGNLLVLPYGGDFLYVEPTYIVSDQGQQPELKLVVFVYKNRIIYGSSPAEALSRLTGVAPIPSAPGSTLDLPPATTREEAIRILQELEQSIRAQQEALENQRRLLDELRKEMGR